MKSKIFVGSCMLLAATASHSASNSAASYISSFETRTTGAHAVFLAAGMPQTESCSVNDRGVLVEGDAGAKTALAMIYYALANNKQVVLRVNGCTSLQPGENSLTAPQIVKVQLIN